MDLREAVSEVVDLPLDPEKVTDDDMLAGRRQAAVLIRELLWLGPNPPRYKRRWNMARDLSIWNRLAEQHGPVQVNGAITVMRHALGLPAKKPVTMLIFYGKGRRHYLNRCIQEFFRIRNEQGDDSKVGSLLRELAAR